MIITAEQCAGKAKKIFFPRSTVKYKINTTNMFIYNKYINIYVKILNVLILLNRWNSCHYQIKKLNIPIFYIKLLKKYFIPWKVINKYQCTLSFFLKKKEALEKYQDLNLYEYNLLKFFKKDLKIKLFIKMMVEGYYAVIYIISRD